jgi:hypothetical protein
MFELSILITLWVFFIGVGIIIICIMYGVFDIKPIIQDKFKSNFDSMIMKDQIEIFAQPATHENDQFGRKLRSNKTIIAIQSKYNIYFTDSFTFGHRYPTLKMEHEILDFVLLDKFVVVKIKNKVLLFNIKTSELIDSISNQFDIYFSDHLFLVSKQKIFQYNITNQFELIFTLQIENVSSICEYNNSYFIGTPNKIIVYKDNVFKYSLPIQSEYIQCGEYLYVKFENKLNIYSFDGNLISSEEIEHFKVFENQIFKQTKDGMINNKWYGKSDFIKVNDRLIIGLPLKYEYSGCLHAVKIKN